MSTVNVQVVTVTAGGSLGVVRVYIGREIAASGATMRRQGYTAIAWERHPGVVDTAEGLIAAAHAIKPGQEAFVFVDRLSATPAAFS